MKKVLLVSFIIFCIFQLIVLAVDIDIGMAAIDRGGPYHADIYTMVNIQNPANASGTITSVELYSHLQGLDLLGVTVATFYVVSGNNLSTRDSEYVGDVIHGDTRIFVVDLDVEEGDYLGFVSDDSSYISLNSPGGPGVWKKVGTHIPCADVTFDVLDNAVISLYGTGVTPPPAEINVIFFSTPY